MGRLDCCGDLDDLFAYKTEVKVRLRHKTMGGLYYFAMLCILGGYCGYYQFWLQEGWGQVIELKGTLRATVKVDSDTPVESLPYCTNGGVVQPGTTPPAVRLPCMSQDNFITNKQDIPLVLVIGTRLSTIVQDSDPSCGELQYGCTRWIDSSRVDAFIGNVENATILVQHAVAPASQEAINRPLIDAFTNRSAPFVYGAGGQVAAINCTGYRVPDPICPTAGDLFTLRDLLAVAEEGGLDLDEPIMESSGISSRREAGLSMRINLEYYKSTRYGYRVSANQIESKVRTYSIGAPSGRAHLRTPALGPTRACVCDRLSVLMCLPGASLCL